MDFLLTKLIFNLKKVMAVWISKFSLGIGLQVLGFTKLKIKPKKIKIFF